MGEQTTRLTIVAEARGTSQTADDLQKLADAQREVGDAGKQVGEQVAAAGKVETETKPAIEGLTASHRDYFALLRAVNPVLAQYAQELFHLVKVSGELANTDISLADAGKLASEGIGKLGGALGLLGAGALALYGFNKLSESIHKVKEEAEQARKALEDFHKAQTEIQRGPMESAAEVVAARDKEERLKPFTAEQAESVRQTIAAAPEPLRADLGPILEVLGGAKGMGKGGPFLGSELEALARLGFKPREEAFQGATEREARRFLTKRGADFAAVQERDRELRRSATESAAQEAEHPDVTGGQANFRQIVEEEAKAFGVDAGVMQREVENRVTQEAQHAKRRAPGFRAMPAAGLSDVEPPEVGQWEEERRLRDFEPKVMTVPETGAFQEILRRLGTDRNVTINNTYNQQNAKNIVPGASAQQRTRLNGETRARLAEE